MPLHVSSTVVLIIRRSKLHYTASVIITPVGGRPVRWNIDVSRYFDVQVKIPSLHMKDFQYATILARMALDSNTRT